VLDEDFLSAAAGDVVAFAQYGAGSVVICSCHECRSMHDPHIKTRVGGPVHVAEAGMHEAQAKESWPTNHTPGTGCPLTTTDLVDWENTQATGAKPSSSTVSGASRPATKPHFDSSAHPIRSAQRKDLEAGQADGARRRAGR